MKEKTIRIGNRISGLCMILLGGAFAFTNDYTLLDIGGAIFMSEGAGDLISGDHHYLSSRIVKYLSRDKINLTGGYNNRFGI